VGNRTACRRVFERAPRPTLHSIARASPALLSSRPHKHAATAPFRTNRRSAVRAGTGGPCPPRSACPPFAPPRAPSLRPLRSAEPSPPLLLLLLLPVHPPLQREQQTKQNKTARKQHRKRANNTVTAGAGTQVQRVVTRPLLSVRAPFPVLGRRASPAGRRREGNEGQQSRAEQSSPAQPASQPTTPHTHPTTRRSDGGMAHGEGRRGVRKARSLAVPAPVLSGCFVSACSDCLGSVPSLLFPSVRDFSHPPWRPPVKIMHTIRQRTSRSSSRVRQTDTQ
jgi:hypothetical protein